MFVPTEQFLLFAHLSIMVTNRSYHVENWCTFLFFFSGKVSYDSEIPTNISSDLKKHQLSVHFAKKRPGHCLKSPRCDFSRMNVFPTERESKLQQNFIGTPFYKITQPNFNQCNFLFPSTSITFLRSDIWCSSRLLSRIHYHLCL